MPVHDKIRQSKFSKTCEKNSLAHHTAARERDAFARRGIYGNDYLREDGGELLALDGEPVVPERYRKFIENPPIEATVRRIDEGANVVLDKGTADGVAAGMLLAAHDLHCIEVKVDSANEHESVGTARYFWNSDRKISLGDQFTTGTPFNRPWGTGFPRYRSPPR